ncbi:hypothetical protein [Parvibaculum sp.]|uniref:hypothetical protein n=1 Tax=Parvibaculum sp. TaxID=2024848 RepID=UPI0032973072
MKRQFIMASILSFALAGCTPSTSEIRSSYVSPTAYSDYSCEDLDKERQAIIAEAKTIGDLQEENAEMDAAFMAGFLLVSMPLIVGTAFTKNREEEFALLKGKFQAVHEMQSDKNCEIPAEMRDQAFYTKPPKKEPELLPSKK